MQTPCRLCGCESRLKFRRQLLNKHSVGFHECVGCGSLQTDVPYWLSEAYDTSDVNLDTGAAQRNLASLAASYVLARALSAQNILDFGGGDGLLCRLLRDYGFNCFVLDKFAAATYAMGYTKPDFERADMVLAFEVLEHFAEPARDLPALFDIGAPTIFVTTEIYDRQDKDWWYIAAEGGQHVFFYSRNGIAHIASRFGYRATHMGAYIAFTKSPSNLRLKGARQLLRKSVLPFVRAALQLFSTPGVDRDFSKQR